MNTSDQTAAFSQRITAAVIQGGSGGIGGALAGSLLQSNPDCRLLLTGRRPGESSAIQRLRASYPDQVRVTALDLLDESTIEAAAAVAAEWSPQLLINASGVLQRGGNERPERRIEDLDPAWLRAQFQINAIGPALVAKHFLPIMDRGHPAVFASLSARVGSIGDNRRGGWYGYRASKAALNMLNRSLAVECRRRFPNIRCVVLHPGTVDTPLSAPFQRNVPDRQLFDREQAAGQLLRVIDGLPEDASGGFFAWNGQPIEW